MIDIGALEEDLFTRWRDEDPRTRVKDGCVEPETWVKMPVRVVFILKEVNHRQSPKLLDLRKALHDGPRSNQLGVWSAGDGSARIRKPGSGKLSHTWNNIIRWIDGITRSPIEPWAHFQSLNIDDRSDRLREVCAVNLNKYGGGGTSHPPDVRQAARLDQAWLREQLRLYPAVDFYICCGVGEIVRSFGLLASEAPRRGRQPKTYATSRGVGFWELPSGGMAIDYCHPDARVGDPLVVYPLIDAVAELRRRRGR